MLTHGWRPAAAAATLAVAGVLAAGAAPALAISGIEEVTRISDVDSTSTKEATARCPRDKVVIGGAGGLVWTEQAQSRNVVLTSLLPIHTGFGRDKFVVRASETHTRENDDWWIEAVAICADPIPGLRLVAGSTGYGSGPWQHAEAHCDPGEKVLGTGASLSSDDGEVGLQISHADANGDYAYAAAHEDHDGYASNWNLGAYAMCAPEPAGYSVVEQPSLYDGSMDAKLATATCPAGTDVTGAGGAVSYFAYGNAFLNHLIVDPAFRSVLASGMEAFPTDDDWGSVWAQAICAA
jgi:hypothetical protein